MPQPVATDAEIIARSLDRPAKFGLIFERHFESVFRFCARRVGAQEAADVTADVFERALRLRRRFDLDRESCLPWLYGIATNVVGDRLRRLKRGDRVFLKVSDEPRSALDVDDIESRVVAESVRRQLNDALSRLPRTDRETFLLFALEELTYAEIAVALGVPPGTVGSRINRARRKLSEQLPDLDQILDVGRTNESDDGHAR